MSKSATSRSSFCRRKFVGSAVGAAAMSVLPSTTKASSRSKPKPNLPKVSVFTKPFVSLSYEQLARMVKKMGFDGIEAPIRKGGHVNLERIETELPRLATTLKEHGLDIAIMASDINEANSSNEKVLKVAKSVGITRYRLKYFKYGTNSIKRQLADWTAKLRDLAALNAELGVVGLYQNHAGNRYFGAAIWDLASVLEKIDSKNLGAAYDIRHATVEGGKSWPTTMRRIIPWTRMMYVKDFRWNAGKLENVPLGEGMVDKRFFQMAKKAGFEGPISLHEEYLPHSDPKIVPKHVEAMTRDLRTLQSILESK